MVHLLQYNIAETTRKLFTQPKKDTAMKIIATDYLNYGTHLARKGKTEDAILIFCRTIKEDPLCAKAYNNLGVLLRKKKQLPEAECCLQRAVELNPNDAISYNNLGLVFLDMQRLEAAKICLQQALKLNPQQVEIYNSLGLVYEEDKQMNKALVCYRQAIKMNPKFVEAYFNLGTLLKTVKQLDEAESQLEQAVRLCPHSSDANFALATLRLLEGRYEEGWKLYDAFRLKQSKNRAGNIPLWRGEDITNLRVLLFYDQGFGDTLQFVRYTNIVMTWTADVVLWIQSPLKKLLAASYPDVTIYDGNTLPTGHYDYASPLMSLPKVFNTTVQTIPRNIPYIHPSIQVVKKWKKKLGSLDNFNKKKIGVVWAGNPKHHNDRNRSIPFAVFRNLFTMSNVMWVSLQLGKRANDIMDAPESLINYSAELVDFSQTAGLIANLDLVITVDSAVAHLAGAMGKTTWVLVPFAPDWRWQLDREDSSWYPTLRLFRQETIGDWHGVINRVKLALQ